VEDVNTVSDQLIKALVWILPGVLLLVGIILAFSGIDRHRRKPPTGQDQKPRPGSQRRC
jgi:cytochrome c-type biogenesis protein CcmH/NrfF